MEGQVVDIFSRCGLFFLYPFMGAHIAHPMEMGSVFEGNGGSTNVADEYAGFRI